MRIVSGIYKGHTIKAPQGQDTRPTTDRVRESIISSIISRTGELNELYIVDVFAGSGALGLECISRGAKYCTFCDLSKQATNIIKSNISSLKIDNSEAKAISVDIFRSGIPRAMHPYDVVLLDPPYKIGADEVFTIISSAIEKQIIDTDALIVYEYSSTSNLEVASVIEEKGYTVLSHKTYGSTSVDIISARS